MYPISFLIYLLMIETFEHFELRSQEKCFRMCGRYGKEYRWKIHPSIQNIYPVNCDTFAETWNMTKKNRVNCCIDVFICANKISNYMLLTSNQLYIKNNSQYSICQKIYSWWWINVTLYHICPSVATLPRKNLLYPINWGT